MEFSATIDANKLTGIKKRISNAEPPLRSAASYMKGELAKQFSSGTDPNGKPWEPLKESTLRTKKQNRDKILIRTGRMSQGFIFETTGAKLRITNSVDYALYHQYGTRKMAVRLLIGFTPTQLGKIKKLIVTYITSKRR